MTNEQCLPGRGRRVVGPAAGFCCSCFKMEITKIRRKGFLTQMGRAWGCA